MKTKAYLEASVVIFTLVALMHLIRLLQGWPILVGTLSIPVWGSVLVLVVSAGVAIWGFTLIKKV